jgi:hypothetical protein
LIWVAVCALALTAQDRSTLLAPRMIDPVSGRVMSNVLKQQK